MSSPQKPAPPPCSPSPLVELSPEAIAARVAECRALVRRMQEIERRAAEVARRADQATRLGTSARARLWQFSAQHRDV